MSGSRIVDYVHAHWHNLPKRPTLNDKELQAATVMIEIANSANEGDYDIVSKEYVTQFEEDTQDKTWTPEDEEYHKLETFPDVVTSPGKPNLIQFGKDELVEQSKVQEAVDYYGSEKGFHRNGSRIRPTLTTMQSKFRFIKEESHLKKLREYENNGKRYLPDIHENMIGAVKANRKNNLELLSIQLAKDFQKCIEEGKILHDASLRFIIRDIIRRDNLDLKNFKASPNWLAGWKRRFGLSSRKITKFVANIRHKSREQIEKDAKEFVAKANQLFSLYNPSNIFNADQSGFQLEMHTARTITFTGLKHVPCVVQNVTSTTHSYTVLPVISADGKLYPMLFVCLKERNGQFPAKGHFDAPNLVVTCHSSHIMTKDLMKTFFQKIIFSSSMPRSSLLLLDSWTCWKDQAAIDSVTPRSKKTKILVIPPGCTGHVQPCDVGIFGAFKKVVKTITGHAQLIDPDYKIYQRDETLKMLSLVWWQLCSPKLEGWVQYAWFASGYDVPRPPPFKTPAQLMFPHDVARDCDISGCPTTSFVTCVYCEKYFCFDHFVKEFHKCC